jgi:copper(I)-binding protein
VDGATFPLTLIFEKAGEIEVEVPVDLARLTETPADQAAAGEAHDHGEAAHEHAEEAHDHGDEAGIEGH